MRRLVITILTTMLLAVTVTPTAAQDTAYRFDLGASVGMSGYLGDVNTANIFRRPGIAGNMFLRYLIDTRWAVKGTLAVAGLSGDSADMTNVLPGGETYRFNSTAYNLDGRIEFNFFNYGIGETYRKLSRWSPYLTLGIGMTVASSSGATHTAASLPMGVGVKYKLKPRINLGIEWKHRQAHPNPLIKENYINFTLGINFNEMWFYQNKIR